MLTNKFYKITCLSILLFLVTLFFHMSLATTLFSPPSHIYYKQINFTESELTEWSYEGDKSLNFLNNKLAFTESQFTQRATLDKDFTSQYGY